MTWMALTTEARRRYFRTSLLPLGEVTPVRPSVPAGLHRNATCLDAWKEGPRETGPSEQRDQSKEDGVVEAGRGLKYRRVAPS